MLYKTAFTWHMKIRNSGVRVWTVLQSTQLVLCRGIFAQHLIMKQAFLCSSWSLGKGSLYTHAFNSGWQQKSGDDLQLWNQRSQTNGHVQMTQQTAVKTNRGLLAQMSVNSSHIPDESNLAQFLWESWLVPLYWMPRCHSKLLCMFDHRRLLTEKKQRNVPLCSTISTCWPGWAQLGTSRHAQIQTTQPPVVSISLDSKNEIQLLFIILGCGQPNKSCFVEHPKFRWRVKLRLKQPIVNRQQPECGPNVSIFLSPDISSLLFFLKKKEEHLNASLWSLWVMFFQIWISLKRQTY